MVDVRHAVVVLALFVVPISGAASLQAADPFAAEPLTLERVLGAHEMEDGLLWMPEADSGIGPGRALRIEFPDGSGTGCTANFVWADEFGNLFLGTAGHCLLPSNATATHGPDADYDASGVVVSFASPCDLQPSTFVAGITMCISPSDFVWTPLGKVMFAEQDVLGRDFGIVHIPKALHHLVRYDIPGWGTPHGTGAPTVGDPILHYGHGLGYEATPALRHRAGVALGPTTVNGFLIEPSTVVFAGGVNGGDSGSAAATGAHDGAGGLHVANGTAIITHGAAYVAGVFFGTSTETAKLRTLCLTGHRLVLIPGDASPPDPDACAAPPPEPAEIEEPAPGPGVAIDGDQVVTEVSAGEVLRFNLELHAPNTFERFVFDSGPDAVLAGVIRPAGPPPAIDGDCAGLPSGWTASISSVRYDAVGIGEAYGHEHAPEHPAGLYEVTLVANSTTEARLRFASDVDGSVGLVERTADPVAVLQPVPPSLVQTEDSWDLPLGTTDSPAVVLTLVKASASVLAGEVETSTTITGRDGTTCAHAENTMIHLGKVASFGSGRAATAHFAPAGPGGSWQGAYSADVAAWTPTSTSILVDGTLHAAAVQVPV